jgi:aldose 1-epimerase
MDIALRAGNLALTLAPDTGGAIAAFTWRGVDLLRPVADPRLAAQHGRAVAGYPLIPYANRIADGRFAWAGETHQLARNFGDDPNTIHGNAWMRRWAVAESGPRHARLTLDHAPPHDPADQWPFAYHAEQSFALDGGALRIALSVENRDNRAWPAGLGLHPYVARTPRATLRFSAEALWTTDARGLPSDRVPARGDTDFAAPRLLDGPAVDACYVGWGGSAAVAQPERGLVLTLSAASPMNHLQLYTPEGRDFLGLEPVTNMPDAINRLDSTPDQGLRILAPGETLRAAIEIGLSP